MHDISLTIAKDLHLNMAWALDIFLNQHIFIPERARSFAFATGEGSVEIRVRFDLAHPLTAAACNGLYQYGITNHARFRFQEFRRLVFAVIAGGDRHARLIH